MKKRTEPRRTLGTVERHKVERWLAGRLRTQILRAQNRDAARQLATEPLAVAAELSEMLVVFQRRDEG